MTFLMVPMAPITTGTVVVLSPHIRSTSISKSLYLLSFSVVLTEVLVSRGIVMSMRGQVLSFLFFNTMSGLLAAMVLSVSMGMSHRMVALSFSVIVLGSCSYHRPFTSMPNSLQIFQCMCATAFLWRWVYSVLASSGQQRPECQWSRRNGHVVCFLGPLQASRGFCVGTSWLGGFDLGLR